MRGKRLGRTVAAVLASIALLLGLAGVADATPSHPTVTFTEAPLPFTHDPDATAPFPNPTPKDLLALLTKDKSPRVKTAAEVNLRQRLRSS